MATKVKTENHVREKCGNIIYHFKMKQIREVSYFKRSFKSLEEFTNYINKEGIEPIIPVRDAPYVL